MDYDLVVIGAGPGGEKAAVAAAFFGKRVALIEKSDDGPGGAGVHTGTLPSKTLRETALYLTGFKRRELYQNVSFGVAADRSATALMCRLPQVRTWQTEQIRKSLNEHGVELIKGFGELVGDHRVRVGDRELETRYILIATGSSPRRPDQFDFDDPEVFDSDSILRLDRIPDSLAVVGGGVIGSEYACVFSALGTKIKIVERRERLLGFLDHEISDALMDSMRAQDISLCLADEVESVVREYDDLILTLHSGRNLRVDKALISAGRTGNTAGLGLDRAGVEVDARGRVLVDARFRTNVSNIYAVGDVIGHPALASAAMEQGRMAAADMFDERLVQRDFSDIPAGIYTIPEACACGPTEEQLRERGVPFVVGRSQMRHNARGQIIGDTDGFIKLLFHAETKKLLGTHIIAERATELIHVGQAVMRLSGGIDYFIESVMSYPSLSVAYKYAAYDALAHLDGVPRMPPPPSVNPMSRSGITLYRPEYPSVRLINCSPPSWMIEIALREKGLPFAVRALSFAKGEHKTPDMLALNPRGTIPVLTVDEAVLWESLAMLEHIDDICPRPTLLGTDPSSRARARNRLHESAGLKQRGMALFSYYMRNPPDSRDDEQVGALRANFLSELNIWCGYYADSQWAAGSEMTLADISVYTYLVTARHLGLSLTGQFASLGAFVDRMGERHSVTTDWPWSGPAEETPLAGE